jgi:hypothetical protein
MPDKPKKLTPAERKARADALLKDNPRFRRMTQEERGPEGVTQITVGRWIPGSRPKRGS